MRVNITDELKILKERFHLFESLGMFVLLVLLLSVVASLYSLVTGRDLGREHQHQALTGHSQTTQKCFIVVHKVNKRRGKFSHFCDF